MPRPQSKWRIRAAIITYYRRKARGSRVTLKEICDQMELNYDSVRVAKVAYDKQRRRGKKTNTEESNTAPEGSAHD